MNKLKDKQRDLDKITEKLRKILVLGGSIKPYQAEYNTLKREVTELSRQTA